MSSPSSRGKFFIVAVVIIVGAIGLATWRYVRLYRVVNPPVLYEPMTCGGIAGINCPSGYVCQYQESGTTDAAGYCTSAPKSVTTTPVTS
ncbi:MAG: hypothetical protein HY984_02460 [Candidatus Magasanikbacteria bacterium]|nr:hypothetical protein [Candidatus Magasanikbacteria bacterium]